MNTITSHLTKAKAEEIAETIKQELFMAVEAKDQVSIATDFEDGKGGLFVQTEDGQQLNFDKPTRKTITITIG